MSLTSPSARAPATNPYLEGNFAPVSVETTAFDLPVRGMIPDDLEGRLVRIGPNPIGAPDPATYHWFMGTGMAHGVRLRGGKAEWYRNRTILSDTVAAALGRPGLPGPRNGARENTANTNIVDMGGKTYAIVEAGGLPVELSYTLDSIARSDLGGTLRHGFAAHPKHDPRTGLHHVLTYEPGLEALTYLVVDARGRARDVAAIPAPHGPMVHDVAFTATRLIVLDLPVTFDKSAAARGFPFAWNPERMPRVGLLPLDGDLARLVWVEAPSCYVFHVMNAFDDGDAVIVDVVRHPRVFDHKRSGPGEGAPMLARWRVDPTTGRLSETILEERGCEFPRFNDAFAGRAYGHGYSVSLRGRDTYGPLLKHDVARGRAEAHDFGPGRVSLEPVFVARPGAVAEDDGWILCYVYDAARDASDVVILDARDFSGPPVATITLPVRVPFGFHGNWLPDQA